MASQNLLLPEHSRIVQPKYLEKHTSKKDLVRRLTNLVKVLQDEETPVEAESPEWPGLAATADCLVAKYLRHCDKEVRLHTVLACTEIFTIYAPDVPWDEAALLEIFRQMTRQLGNLAHTTEGHGATFFRHYEHILHLLASVRIGCILVDLAQQEDGGGDGAAQEVLIEFIRTLLSSVRREHPAEILELVQQTIVACLDEYNNDNGVPFPIPILDELLLSIGQGRTMWIIDPNQPQPQQSAQQRHRKKKRTQDLPQIEVTNPTYVVAAAVIRSLLNKIATPVSSLLNGLLHCDSNLVDLSEIRCGKDSSDSKDVYSIVFELHNVAPQILTTVIGTVANGLRSTLEKERSAVTQLLGRLFVTGNFAEQYAACFRDWLGRRLDVSQDIRINMVKQCMAVLQAQTTKRAPNAAPVEPAIAQQTADALRDLSRDQQSVDVRLAAIHEICDWAYQATSGCAVTAQLLRAVGDRVSSKHKTERKDAITGLAHVYSKQWVQAQLKSVIDGGDDCDLGVILAALHETCHLEDASTKSQHRGHLRHDGDAERKHTMDEQYGWIPIKVFECCYFTDQKDPEMRSRVVQIVDEILLGPDKKMTPTARAMAFTMVLDSLLRDSGGVSSLMTEVGGHRSNAFKFLLQLLGQRALLQKTISCYIDARAEMRECESGSEQALEADARAMEVLEMVSKMTAPATGASIDEVLQSFHSARDKHIFRILATIVSPGHTAQARARALEELPKRTKALGDAVSEWVKNVVKRCAMGNSLNSEVVKHCVILAQECFRAGDVPASSALVATVKTVIDICPSLCAGSDTFNTLTELFSETRSISSSSAKKEVRDGRLVTALSSMLSVAATLQNVRDDSNEEMDKDALKTQLTQMCTRDGTPEQARNAVYTLARLLNPSDKHDLSSVQDHGLDAFATLLQTLTSASKLKISSDEKQSLKVISIMSALSALTDCAPLVMQSSTRGGKAIKFALEAVLLGRDHSANDTSDGDETEDDGDEISPTPSSTKRKRSSSLGKSKHSTPESKTSLLENDTLSAACRRICAAVDFLVSYIRSTTLAHIMQKQLNETGKPTVTPPEPDQVRFVFQLLAQMIHDQGLPPSNRDRKLCKSRQDRAALRQCAAVSLLRLSDGRLKLEPTILSQGMWHTLGGAFLDEERAVREAVMEELSLYLRGAGSYGPTAPSLRLVAMTALCSDGEHDNYAANGGAANVGKAAAVITSASLHAISSLRKALDNTHVRCVAMGKEAERKFDADFKYRLMPEYAIPYAFHLLVHRRETPGTSVSSAEDDDDMFDDGRVSMVSDESQQKVLRRRLKMLFGPLVQSLGEGADNISFLLRMTEILAKRYTPVPVSSFYDSPSSPHRLSIDSNSTSGSKRKYHGVSSMKDQALEVKLKVICTAAREVLLSYVKKDVNLADFPGQILLPKALWMRTDVGTLCLSKENTDSPNIQAGKKDHATKKVKAATKKFKAPPSTTARVSVFKRRSGKPLEASPDMHNKRHVVFSPEVEFNESKKRNYPDSPGTRSNDSSLGDDLSPIAKSASPASLPRTDSHRGDTPNSSGGDTLGTTPPLQIATMRSTAHDDSSDENDSKLASPSPKPKSTMLVSQHSVDAEPFHNDNPDAELGQISLGSTQESDPSLKSQPSEKSSLRFSQDSVHSSKSSGSRPSRKNFVGKVKAPSKSKKPKIMINRAVKPKPSSRESLPSNKRKNPKRSSKQVVDEFDFEDDGLENQPVSRNQKGDTGGGKAIASAKSTTASRGHRAGGRRKVSVTH